MTEPKTGKAANLFLESLTLETTKQTFEYLVQLVDVLENKIDPEPVELRLLENIYHFLEKFKHLEHNLRSYVKETNSNLPGNKLSTLYENISSYGTSSLFKS